jgi:F-type H+-transporting ATPase subunit epsilon
MASLKFKLLTPDRTVLEGETASLTAMTVAGEITILPGHIPLATLLKAGEMRVKTSQGEELLAVSGGMLEVKPGNEILILAETAEHSSELELAAIEEAKKRAEEALVQARSKDAVGYADAAAHLERELARYRVAMKGKGRQRNIES